MTRFRDPVPHSSPAPGPNSVESASGSARALDLREVLSQRAVRMYFQPIVCMADGRTAGYECLARGLAGGKARSPCELFPAAAEQGYLVDLNILCIQEALRGFAAGGLTGDIFLNLSPAVILQPGFDRQRARRFLDALGLSPERVVIELTEDHPTFDGRLVGASLRRYRDMGFRVAIDDLGEGFASLRLWSELRPEFVKADKHFVTGVANDPVKRRFLRAIQDMAAGSATRVIAEGIEEASDFQAVRDVGIAYGQGWYIGRPSERPGPRPNDAFRHSGERSGGYFC